MTIPDEKANILAVDDSPQKLLALSALLSELGQNVVTANSGREALRELLRQEFAVVLLDVNMPGMDGFETAAMMRQRKSSEHTPIIFITAYGDDTHATRGYSLGAVDYILAPVEPEVLRTKVGVFVELFRKTAQVRQQAQSLEQRARQLQRLTEASLAINSALSPDRMLQVVADLARDILGAQQAVAVAAPEQKWSAAKSAVSLSPAYSPDGERRVLRDRDALVSLLSWLRRTVRLPRDMEKPSDWQQFFGGTLPLDVGWLAAPLTGRDGRNSGLLHLLEKADGDFSPDDEAVLTQLAQMSSIAIENTLNAEAREANRIKDEFLTTLSHELRTPLTAILGWSRALRSAPPDEQRTARGLEVIERNVLAQTKLIDDLLDVSRIITGKLRLTLRATSLASVVEAALDSMRPAADAKEIEIRFHREVAADEDELIADPDRIQQVVWNLISNAIKFTPPRGKVDVHLKRADSQFEVRVTDTGKGIPPEFLPSAFDRFQQADSSTTRTHGGLGIGLAIVRHLVELHGGSVSASSEGPDRGASFCVRLPAVALGVTSLERERGASPRPLVSAAGAANLAGVRVLLVEDERDGRELLAEILTSAGGEVRAVASAAEAMEAVAEFRPDVLVSDIAMAEEDGYSLVRRLRRLAPADGGRIPAVAVSAYAREDDRIRSSAAGFQVHIAKPLDPEELVSTVDRLAHPAAASPFRDAAARAPDGPAHGNGNGTLSRVLVVEDDGDSREGLRNLLEVWGHDVLVAENGVAGIEMAMAGRPDIALIDVGMPGLDGYAVAARLRELLGNDEIFLIALTGYAEPEDRLRAEESGFHAHLAKPINYSRLSSLLAEGNRRDASGSDPQPKTAG